MKISKLLFVAVLAFNAASIDYNYFSNTLQGKCKNTKKLVFKKTFLSFVRNKDLNCESGFAKKLLSTCSEVTCGEVVQLYQVSIGRESGAIIGGSN